MKKEVLKKMWLIPFVIGLIIVTIGIVKLVQASKIVVPEMGQQGWFDASASKDSAFNLGLFLTIFGALISFAVAPAIKIAIKQGTMSPQERAKKVAEVEKQKEEFFNALEKKGVDISSFAPNSKKHKKRVCDYCGAELGENETKCPCCGSSISKK